MKIIVPILMMWWAIGGFCQSVSAKEPPNVLFIAVDDLRDWVGHLGRNPQVRTPNLDRLAKRGVSFRHAYCAAPLCNPSRISLLTGVAPANSGVYGNGEEMRDKMPEVITLMQYFRASGYDVRGCGKIFHGTTAYDQKSWDGYFVPTRSRKKVNPQRDMGLPETAWTPWGKVDLRDHEMFDGKVASWMISEFQKPRREPFFLACGFTKPHLPWIVPRKYFNLYPLDTITLPPSVSDDLSDVPSFGRRLARQVYDPSGEKDFAMRGGDHANIRANGQWRTAVQAYLATISFVDAQIGRVLDALDNSQYAENTIIVLWGDHGWHLGEKEHWRKHALWDVSTRTPLIIAGASNTEGTGGVARDQVCDRPVSLLDIYPTLLDLCRLPRPDGLDGRSLQRLLRTPEQPWDHPVVTTFGFNNHAVQTSRWRYIRYRDGGEELYDHASDPNEWTNLAVLPEHEAIITELKTCLPKENKR
jgi:arylsulfatase A-like enzyme